MYATASPAAGTPRLSGLRALASHMQAGRFQSSQSAAAAAPPPAATGAAAAEEEFKVYISADIEGIGGVVNEAHLGPGGFEYEKARQWMTAETVAAAEAALEAGASSVVISDSHGNGCNIMPDELPPNCKLVRSWPRELGMMCGLDSSFACAMLIGFHPGTASLGGVRAHTFSSSSLTSIKINGVETSESGIAALTAGELGVPIIMASGDNFLEEEIHATLGDSVEVAVVKTGLSFHAAECLRPVDAQALVKETAAAAIENFKAGHSSLFCADEGPITLDISTKNYRSIEMLAFLPIVERVDSHTARFVVDSMEEASRMIEFVTGCGVTDLSP